MFVVATTIYLVVGLFVSAEAQYPDDEPDATRIIRTMINTLFWPKELIWRK